MAPIASLLGNQYLGLDFIFFNSRILTKRSKVKNVKYGKIFFSKLILRIEKSLCVFLLHTVDIKVPEVLE